MTERSYLFAPGSNPRVLVKAFTAGADALMLDLEDAVAPADKDLARRAVARILQEPPAPVRAWVRVNTAGGDWCAADLDAVAPYAHGIRIPKVESPADVEWVLARAPGLPVICAIETARGVLAAAEIAAVPGITHLAMGGVDLRRDLGLGPGDLPTLYVRSHLVVCSRAAGLGAPIDSVFPALRDEPGLRGQAEFARSLGFGGKSVIHPAQLPVVHEVFGPSSEEREWARRVVEAFDAAGGNALQMPDGEFVDLPVAERARRVLEHAG